jgi:hypothetical protein
VDDVAHRAEPYHEDARRGLGQRRLPVLIQSQFGARAWRMKLAWSKGSPPLYALWI